MNPLSDLSSTYPNIKVSSQSLQVINATYHTPIYVSVYFRHVKSKKNYFLRFCSVVKILPGEMSELKKPSLTSSISHSTKLFFSTNKDTLTNAIPIDFMDRVGSYSLSISNKLFISIENGILEAYKPSNWKNFKQRNIKYPKESIHVRSAFDIVKTESIDNDLKNINSLMSTSTSSTNNDRMITYVPLPNPKKKYYCPIKPTPISNEEKEILKKREEFCKKSLLDYIPQLNDLLNDNENDDDDESINSSIPGIALCLSGGSYRSLVASLGALQSMKESGLLDCINYISCLSGTVWSVGMWYSFENQSLDNLMESLPSMLKNTAHSYLKSKDVWNSYRKSQKFKKSHNLPRTRLSDLYSSCISKQLLSGGLGKDAFTYPISKLSEISKLRNGELPIPIFNAVFKEPHSYEWMEISPFEIGSDYLSSFVPTNGFGSRFVNGELSYLHPEITLGQLFGLSSAVFCLTTHRLWREILLAYELHPKDVAIDVQSIVSHHHKNTITYPRRRDSTNCPNTPIHEISITNLQNTIPGDIALSILQKLDSEPSDDPLIVRETEEESEEEEEEEEEDNINFQEKRKEKHENINRITSNHLNHEHEKQSKRKRVKIVRQIDKKIEKLSITNKYLVKPITFPNFSYGMPSPMKRKKFIQLVDAGMDYCVPLPPLLKSDRNINIIIIIDISAPPDCVEGNSLQAAIRWAKNHGYFVPDVPYDCINENENYYVFESNHPNSPTLIYIPMRKLDEYGEFDPVENYAEGGYCSTSALNMTPEQIKELSGLFSSIMTSVNENIKNVILNSIIKTPKLSKL